MGSENQFPAARFQALYTIRRTKSNMSGCHAIDCRCSILPNVLAVDKVGKKSLKSWI
jgi:hypothetical protein